LVHAAECADFYQFLLDLAGVYALVPELQGKNAFSLRVGHFWVHRFC
jgi:hypothetical protein